MPFRPAFDSNAKSIPGAQIWFTLTGTNTPAAVYSDAGLTTPLANPVVANAVGHWPTIYLDDGVTYRARAYDADATVGVDTAIEEYDPYTGAMEDALLRADLISTSGATMVRVADGDSVQDKFDLVFGGDRGAIADEVGSDMTISRSFSGVGSSSGLYGENNQIRGYGAVNIGSIRAVYFGANVDTTAGVTDLLESAHFFAWVKNAGNVAVAKVVEAHLVAGRDDNGVDKAGTITTEGIYYNCAGITLGTTITIPKVTGFNCGQIVSTTQVTNGYGFNCEHNQTTAGSGQFAGFRSQVRAATGSWSFLANTNTAGVEAAPAGFTGKVSIGNNSGGGGVLEPFTPSYMLDVKATVDDWSARIGNRSGGTPSGLFIDLTFAATPNTTQMLIGGSLSGNFHFKVFTNGNVVNTNNSYGAISDRSLKSGIRDSTPQLDDVLALRVRKFRLKAEGKDGVEQIGLVAQEVEEVSPGLVYKTKEGKKTVRGVNYSIVNVKLLKAFQELAAIVEEQGKEIAALKAAKL